MTTGSFSVRRPTSNRCAIVVLALATALLAGCAPGASGSRSAAGEVTVALAASPASLDYTRNAGAAIPQALLYNVYETLVKIDQDGAVKPLLARSWTVSPDRRVYTFELQPGVRFSNGAPMTADDVKFSLDRLGEWTTPPAAQLAGIAATTVLGPTTVRITSEQPDNALLTSLAGPAGTIFTPDGIATLASDPIGTGPYEFESYDRGVRMRLVARDGYWGAAPPAGRLTLVYYSDPTAQTNALLTGGADAAIGVTSPQVLPMFRDNPAFRVTSGTTTGEMMLPMNCAVAPFDDIRVRQAVRYAVNTAAVREIAAEGYGEDITTMVPPSDPWFEKGPGPYPYDPERARALLDEAGATGTTVTFKVPNLPQYVRAAQAVQSDLERVGLQTDMQVLEFPAVWLGEVISSKNFQLAIINHAEPRDITKFSDPKFYIGYRNPAADAVLASARSGPPEEYVPGMREYARMISEDAPADFLYLTPWINVVSARVSGEPTDLVSESIDLTRIQRS
jgi:peptide/nickel transport system substrate-binding protein